MEQVFGSIPAVLSGLGSNAGVDEAIIFAAWARCAGDLLRARTAPVEFFENRLVIAVQDETWRRHLEDLSPQMLVKINRSLGQGTVRFIEFRIDESVVKAALQIGNSDSTAKTHAAEIAPPLADAAKAITDDNLRKQFLSAAAVYLAKQEETVQEVKVKM